MLITILSSSWYLVWNGITGGAEQTHFTFFFDPQGIGYDFAKFFQNPGYGVHIGYGEVNVLG